VADASLSLSSPEQLLGHVLANRYLLEQWCESSSFGSTYRAYHLGLDRNVLLRILPERSGVDRDACRRALRAGTRVAALANPHVSRTLDVGLLGTHQPFFVAEYAKGHSLARTLSRQGALPVDSVIHIGAQTAEALQAAHRAHVLHGTLDLDSLWVDAPAGGRERVRVLGFGLVELPRLDFDGVESGVFTAAFRDSSERAAPPSSPAVRSDIYALGACLYQLASGSRPDWTARSVGAILDTDFADAGRPAHRAVRRGLAMILQRCLQLLPDTNYAAMEEVLHDLERLKQSAASIRPPSPSSPNLITAVHTPPPVRGISCREPKVIVRGS